MSEIYIKQKDALDRIIAYGRAHEYDDNPCIVYACENLERQMNAIPAADVREVVFCRDCKHKGWVQEPEHGKSVDYCRLIERCVGKQFFCAAGEKREES